MRLLGRDPLGLGDDALLDLAGLYARLVAGDLELRAALAEQGGQIVEPAGQTVEVADGVRLGDRLAKPVDRVLGLRGGQIASS